MFFLLVCVLVSVCLLPGTVADNAPHELRSQNEPERQLARNALRGHPHGKNILTQPTEVPPFELVDDVPRPSRKSILCQSTGGALRDLDVECEQWHKKDPFHKFKKYLPKETGPSAPVLDRLLLTNGAQENQKPKVLEPDDVLVTTPYDLIGYDSTKMDRSERFPGHWGQPPKWRTTDLKALPNNYGMGSSTLKFWIQDHLDKDAKLMTGQDVKPAKKFNDVRSAAVDEPIIVPPSAVNLLPTSFSFSGVADWLHTISSWISNAWKKVRGCKDCALPSQVVAASRHRSLWEGMMLLGGQKVAQPTPGAPDTLPDKITHDTLKELQENASSTIPVINVSPSTADSGMHNIPDEHTNDQTAIEQQPVTDIVTKVAHAETDLSINNIIPKEEDTGIDAIAPVKEAKGKNVFKSKRQLKAKSSQSPQTSKQ